MPTVRGWRFPRSHRSSPNRRARRSGSFDTNCARQSAFFDTSCARQSASFATRCVCRSARWVAGSAGRRVSRSARSASCTSPGWKRLLVGRGISGSGIPENGLLIFLRPPQKFWLQLAGGERERSKDREIGVRAVLPDQSCTQSVNSQSHGASRQKLHLPQRARGMGETGGPAGQCARRIGAFMLIEGRSPAPGRGGRRDGIGAEERLAMTTPSVSSRYTWSRTHPAHCTGC